MSKNGVLKMLATLTAAYMKDLPDPTIRLYVNGLADLDDNALAGAAEELVVKSKFFPTIADIRECAVFRMVPGGRPPTADVAWHEVTLKMAQVGRVDRETPDCLRCENKRWLYTTDKDGTERAYRCNCLDTVIQKPRPPFSHPMIGAAIDVCGGYNRLFNVSDRERESTKKVFIKTYNDLILGTIAKSIHLDAKTQGELPT